MLAQHAFSSHVRFSPNAKFVLAATLDSTIRLWNCHTSRCVKTYKGHTNRTFCLFSVFGRAVGPDGVGERQVVVSGSEDNKVYLWDLQTRQVLQILEGHRDAVLAVAVRGCALIELQGCSADHAHADTSLAAPYCVCLERARLVYQVVVLLSFRVIMNVMLD
jgi:WD40 repeat protein